MLPVGAEETAAEDIHKSLCGNYSQGKDEQTERGNPSYP